MSKTKPIRRLFCSKCKEDYNKTSMWAWDSKKYLHHPESYMDIIVVERVGDSIKCRCNQCGYEYLSRSRAAHLIINLKENNERNKI